MLSSGVGSNVIGTGIRPRRGGWSDLVRSGTEGGAGKQRVDGAGHLYGMMNK